jgi:hypothetical protein
MKRQQFVIANHMRELGNEILQYHRDEDFKIVRQRDDLISAVVYAFMARRSGKPLVGIEMYGKAPGAIDVSKFDPLPSNRYASAPRRQRYVRGSPNHPDGPMNPWTGR